MQNKADMLAKLKQINKLYLDLVDHAADTSTSVIGGGRGERADGAHKTQQLAAYALIVIDDRLNFCVELAELELEEIRKIIEVISTEHQCYSGQDGKCVACGKTL